MKHRRQRRSAFRRWLAWITWRPLRGTAYHRCLAVHVYFANHPGAHCDRPQRWL